MKIRIKGNSIRLRLTRSEVDAFGRDGYVEERTEFGNNLFIYALRRSAEAKELCAAFVGIKITMLVPWSMADEWTTTEKVGFSNTFRFDNGKEIALLLEKDFKCIDAAVTEDQSDNYENPLISCAPAPQAEAIEDRYEHPANEEVVASEQEPVAGTETVQETELTQEPVIVSQAEAVQEVKFDTQRWSAFPEVNYQADTTAHHTPEVAKEETIELPNRYFAGQLPTEVKYESDTAAQYTVPEVTEETRQPEKISFFAAPEVVEEQTSDTIEEQPFGFTAPTIEEPVSFTAPEPPVTEVFVETPPAPPVEEPQPEQKTEPAPTRPSGRVKPPHWR